MTGANHFVSDWKKEEYRLGTRAISRCEHSSFVGKGGLHFQVHHYNHIRQTNRPVRFEAVLNGKSVALNYVKPQSFSRIILPHLF